MSDRTLPVVVRITLVMMAVMQTGFGLTLLINPAAINAMWPWPLSPIAARVLGASTLVSTPLALLSVVANRWSVARIPIVMMLAYRVLQISAGAIHYQSFDPTALSTWNYFGAGGLMLLILLVALVRGSQMGQPVTTSPRWLRGEATLNLSGLARGVVRGLAGVYLIVGVLCFGLGEQAGMLWFEPAEQLTGLTARLFASPATGLALAMILITRAKYWREIGVPAIGLVTFGLAGALAFGLEYSGLQPSTALGYLIPLTPLILLGLGVYLLLPARAGAA
jgi:hypothetical protein